MIENQIINKAIDFIFSHIDEELSERNLAHCSRNGGPHTGNYYVFHRQKSASCLKVIKYKSFLVGLLYL